MSHRTDAIMEEASQALVRMDYLTCESLCLRALAAAREARDWALYARILLPLQECRRQRRMIAADGQIRLGSATLGQDVLQALEQKRAACILLTRPHTREDAARLQDAARLARLHVEVLLADNDMHSSIWEIRSFAGPDVTCDRPAPPAEWIDRWLTGRQPAPPIKTTPPQPADWFIDATEALGDAAFAQVKPLPPGDTRRLAALEACLLAVTDHEVLHQRLADAARSLIRPTADALPGSSA